MAGHQRRDEIREIAELIDTALDTFDDNADVDAAREAFADYPRDEHGAAVEAMRSYRDALRQWAAED